MSPANPSAKKADRKSASFDPAVKHRIKLTVSNHDADHLPRVADAGAVIKRNGHEIQVMHNGVLVEAGGYHGDWMTRIIKRLRGVHEPQEEASFAAAIGRIARTLPKDRPPQMIEVGSFWAYYSLWFLHDFPGGRSLCLEPDPAWLEVGRRNFALNGRHGDFLLGALGTDVDAPFRFTTESTNEQIEVPQFDLPSLLARTETGHADLILIDAQGAEIDALTSGLPNFARGEVRFLVVSTHDLAISGSATTHQQALAILRDAGAHIIVEHSVSESFSGDGLIVASFDPRDADLKVSISLARSVDSLFGEWEPRAEAFRLEAAAARADADAARAEVDRLRAEVAQLETQRQEVAARVQDLESSTSWRVTKPLRGLTGALKRPS